MRRILQIFLSENLKTIILSSYLLTAIFFSALLTIGHFPQEMDFGSFLAAGQESLAQENPYDIKNNLVFTVYSTPSPNLNPPISVAFFRLLAKINADSISLAAAWKIISIFWYAAIVIHLFKTNPSFFNAKKVLWVFALTGFWQTIEVGQIYMPLVGVAILAWDNLKKDKTVAAGILIGILISIKPQFAIWALLLFFANQRTAAMYSALTFTIVSLIPLPTFGVKIYTQWLEAIIKYHGILLPGNISLQSFFAHLNISSIGTILSAALLIFILAYVTIKKSNVMQTSAIALTSTLLIAPYSWVGYTLFLLPLFFSQQNWSWRKKTAAGLLTLPFLIVLIFFSEAKIFFILFGWAYGWAVLLLLLDEFLEPTISTAKKANGATA